LKPRLLHVITDLDLGGAERMLVELLRAGAPRSAFELGVISLTTAGQLADEIAAIGLPVRALGLKRVPNPLTLARLAAWMRHDRPAVVQTWLPHADLLGGIAARLAGARVAWGIHQGNPDPHMKSLSVYATKASAHVSRWVPDRIVCCSETSRVVHEERGYDAGRMLVIQNGFDLQRFRPDERARESVRSELGLPAAAPLVGMVSRFHPQKDQRNFVEAAARVRPDAQFVACGLGLAWDNHELAGWIDGVGLRDRFQRRRATPRRWRPPSSHCWRCPPTSDAPSDAQHGAASKSAGRSTWWRRSTKRCTASWQASPSRQAG
jgi:glycosyltransferase involved in cell wall biosynthesis